MAISCYSILELPTLLNVEVNRNITNEPILNPMTLKEKLNIIIQCKSFTYSFW